MKPITRDTLKPFLSSFKVKQIEQEAEIPETTLNHVLAGRRELTEEHVKKLEPVLKKYGWV